MHSVFQALEGARRSEEQKPFEILQISLKSKMDGLATENTGTKVM
jgi:hypothetical protein